MGDLIGFFDGEIVFYLFNGVVYGINVGDGVVLWWWYVGIVIIYCL